MATAVLDKLMLVRQKITLLSTMPVILESESAARHPPKRALLLISDGRTTTPVTPSELTAFEESDYLIWNRNSWGQ